VYHLELFCQTGYQNGSSSTRRAVYGAEAQKNGFNGEVKPCQTGPKNANKGKDYCGGEKVRLYLSLFGRAPALKKQL
jgi:hypothetical protein